MAAMFGPNGDGSAAHHNNNYHHYNYRMETILRQKIRDLLRENCELKELIIFVDDERNYAKHFVKQIMEMQAKNWNSMKYKLEMLERKQFDLIRQNYCLKQLCLLLDNKTKQQIVVPSSSEAKPLGSAAPSTTNSPAKMTSHATDSELYRSSNFLEYILRLESELRSRNIPFERPHHVNRLLRNSNASKELRTRRRSLSSIRS